MLPSVCAAREPQLSVQQDPSPRCRLWQVRIDLHCRKTPMTTLSETLQRKYYANNLHPYRIYEQRVVHLLPPYSVILYSLSSRTFRLCTLTLRTYV